MVEVETSDELERAVNEKTAMMLFFNDADPRGKVKIEEFVALGKKQQHSHIQRRGCGRAPDREPVEVH